MESFLLYMLIRDQNMRRTRSIHSLIAYSLIISWDLAQKKISKLLSYKELCCVSRVLEVNDLNWNRNEMNVFCHCEIPPCWGIPFHATWDPGHEQESPWLTQIFRHPAKNSRNPKQLFLPMFSIFHKGWCFSSLGLPTSPPSMFHRNDQLTKGVLHSSSSTYYIQYCMSESFRCLCERKHINYYIRKLFEEELKIKLSAVFKIKGTKIYIYNRYIIDIIDIIDIQYI